MSRQLTFDLPPPPPALERADFLPAPANAQALALLDQPDAWPQQRLLLIGPEASGKSHLAAFWAAEHGAALVSASDLRPLGAGDLVAPGRPIVVEDAHRIGGRDEAEAALFHLWNLAAQRDARLLVTARTPPRDWGLRLPDLASRMAAMPVVRLEPPDEALLGAVLVKLMADRQLSPGQGVIETLVRHMDRDLGLARRVVALIDRLSLSHGRSVTRSLALIALASLAREGGEGGGSESAPVDHSSSDD